MLQIPGRHQCLLCKEGVKADLSNGPQAQHLDRNSTLFTSPVSLSKIRRGPRCPWCIPRLALGRQACATGSHLFCDPETVIVNADDNNISFRVCFFGGWAFKSLFFNNPPSDL